MSASHNLTPSPGSAPAKLDLRDYTSARVALDRTGSSITTRRALEFSLAHAQARDAVHATLAVPSLLAALRERNLAALPVRSAAPNRTEYLRRILGLRPAPEFEAWLAGDHFQRLALEANLEANHPERLLSA